VGTLTVSGFPKKILLKFTFESYGIYLHFYSFHLENFTRELTLVLSYLEFEKVEKNTATFEKKRTHNKLNLENPHSVNLRIVRNIFVHRNLEWKMECGKVKVE
jgi:hypothetical protein